MTLKNRYNRAMEAIFVTPEMEQRILSRLNEAKGQMRRMPRQTAYGVVAACLALVVFCFAALPRLTRTEPQNPPLQAPNQMQEFDTMEELADSLSFPLSAPTVLPEGYELVKAVNQFGMAQLIYSDGENRMRFYMTPIEDRLALTQYPEQLEAEGVLLQGEGGGWVYAEWDDGAYAYTMICDAPWPEQVFLDAAKSVAPVER